MRYKFRYANSFFKVSAAIINPLQNSFIIIALFLFAYHLLARLAVFIGIDNYFINETVIGLFQRIMFICSVLSVVFYYVLKKGVFLYDDSLVIARYTITPLNWKIRITISYDEIEHVNVNYTNLHFSKNRFLLLVPFGDETRNVELTLKNGKKYFFSIEYPEEFCQNLNFLIENAKGK